VKLKSIKNKLQYLKPHCIQSSRVLVPAGTSKSTLRHHGIQAVTSVMAYVADAVHGMRDGAPIVYHWGLERLKMRYIFYALSLTPHILDSEMNT
jgi:hypothetical protein